LKNYKKTIPMLILLTIGFIYYLIVKLLGITIPCVFYKITNLYCPGCGMGRAVMALSKFEVYQAFRYNSILFIAVPALIMEWQLRKHRKIKVADSIIITLLIIVLGYGILRNFAVFSFLAPTIIQ